MLSLIIGALTGLAGPISQVINNITDLRKRQAESKSEVEKQEIQERIEALHDRKAVLVVEAGNRVSAILNAGTRLALAIPVVAIVAKLYLYDKVIGSFASCAGKTAAMVPYCATFRTDSLSPMDTAVILGVLGFYFLMKDRK